MDVIETPARSSTGSYREEETSTGRSGERNEDLNLNSQERLGADVLTMHQKGSFLKIGTWNVKTLHKIGKLENALIEMKNNKLDMLGIAEMRWTESGSIKKDDHLVMYSGGEQHHET